MTQERYYWHPHQPVRGELPAAYKEASAARRKANVALEEADAASLKAYATLDKVYTACSPAIEALHKVECPDCPWGSSRPFPQKEEKP